MKTNTGCADMVCDRGVAELPRFFPRQLITSDDLTLEQEYFRNKLRMHNRMLHGWGVVCGAQVCMVPRANGNGNGSGEFEPWKVYVKPGYILGPCGDEIVIDCARIVDLRTSGVTGISGEPCVDAVDPWCVEVFEREGPDTLYVAVRYKQEATRPVRVQPGGCGCDDTRCENSRWRDGYEIKVLNYCPQGHEEAPIFDDLFEEAPIPPCPPPSEDPWVGLAKIELDADGVISRIDNCVCRRMVLSHANFWWHCEPPVQVENVQDGGDIERGEERVIRIETATPLPEGTRVEVGRGITVDPARVRRDPNDERVLEVPVKVEPNAAMGTRAMTIILPNQQRMVRPNVINVRPQAAEPSPEKPATDSARKGGKKQRDTEPLGGKEPPK
jgi:hypothetical protein